MTPRAARGAAPPRGAGRGRVRRRASAAGTARREAPDGCLRARPGRASRARSATVGERSDRRRTRRRPRSRPAGRPGRQPGVSGGFGRRAPLGPPGPRRTLGRPGGRVARLADERLPEGQVRGAPVPAAVPGGLGVRPSRQGTPSGRGSLVGHPRRVEPAHRPAEEVGLVDGLRGADVDAARAGGRRCTTRSGTPARSASTTAGCSSTAAVPLVVSTTTGSPVPRRQAEGEEPGAALVVVHVHLDARRRRPAPGPAASTASRGTPRRGRRRRAAHSSTSVAQKVAWRSSGRGAIGARPSDHTPRLRGSTPCSCTPSATAPVRRSCWSTASPRRVAAGDRRPTTSPRDHEVIRVDAPGHGRSADIVAGLRTGGRLRRRPGRRGDLPRLLDGRAPLPPPGPRRTPSSCGAWCCVGGTAGHRRPRRAGRAPRSRTCRTAARIKARRASTPSSTAGWPSRCSPASRRSEPSAPSGVANTVAGLASSLRQAGTGTQDPSWDRLERPGHAGAGPGRRRATPSSRPWPSAWPRSIGTNATFAARPGRRPRRPPRAARRGSSPCSGPGWPTHGALTSGQAPSQRPPASSAPVDQLHPAGGAEHGDRARRRGRPRAPPAPAGAPGRRPPAPPPPGPGRSHRPRPARTAKARHQHRHVERTGCARRRAARPACACRTSVSPGMSRRLLITSRAVASRPTGTEATSDRRGERLGLHVGGADSGHHAEEHEHEHLAEPVVAVGVRAARVEPAGRDRRRPHHQQLGPDGQRPAPAPATPATANDRSAAPLHGRGRLACPTPPGAPGPTRRPGSSVPRTPSL